MEPRIQYARTSDGVNIAYWAMGEGPALVHLNFNFSHVRLEWEEPQVRDWYERLASNRTLVRFDPRGMGLSDGRFVGGPLDSVERDLEAVTSRLGLERFALLGLGHSVPLAIAYAVATRTESHTFCCGRATPAPPSGFYRLKSGPSARCSAQTGKRIRTRWPTCCTDGRRERRHDASLL